MKYLDIKYSYKNKPLNNYPDKFVNYNINKFNLKKKKYQKLVADVVILQIVLKNKEQI